MPEAEQPTVRFGTGGPPGTEFLPDDLPPEEAAEYVELARLVLSAAIWPHELPADPLPAPLELALAIITNRIYRLALTEGQGAMPVVSESLGAYSYRLAQPETFAQLTDGLSGLIAPWLPEEAKGVYELNVGGRSGPWPIDWWQRNYDQLAAEGIPIPAVPP